MIFTKVIKVNIIAFIKMFGPVLSVKTTPGSSSFIEEWGRAVQHFSSGAGWGVCPWFRRELYYVGAVHGIGWMDHTVTNKRAPMVLKRYVKILFWTYWINLLSRSLVMVWSHSGLMASSDFLRQCHKVFKTSRFGNF